MNESYFNTKNKELALHISRLSAVQSQRIFPSQATKMEQKPNQKLAGTYYGELSSYSLRLISNYLQLLGDF